MFLDVDVVDIPAVDDEALADADETGTVGLDLLVVNHGFNLSQLACHHAYGAVSLDNVGIVPVRGDADDAVGHYPYNLIGCGDDEMGLHGGTMALRWQRYVFFLFTATPKAGVCMKWWFLCMKWCDYPQKSPLLTLHAPKG